MTEQYEAIIGLEVHAEMQTKSKMFCSCEVVDNTTADPNVAVCPVCAGMPGMLPVVNRSAVAYGIRVALALGCAINPRSIFARKNYFYPDLPKGYQISQYEEPLARNGRLTIQTSAGTRTIRVRRVHLEEDTGKLTHVEGASLIDLNRAGVPLLEIVSEPDIRSAEEAHAYGEALRTILRYLGVNSGDMQKGVIRFEANVSVRPVGSQEFRTRTEIKNLNSFRALRGSVEYEIERQRALHDKGKPVVQQTMGWDDTKGQTYTQRIKEQEDDYRYFPDPDLPPLVVDDAWVEEIRAGLPELPAAKLARFQEAYGLNEYDTNVLVADQDIANYFEQAVIAAKNIPAKTVGNWITGEIFGWMNQSGETIQNIRVPSEALSDLLNQIQKGEINQTTGKAVLVEMLQSGSSARQIIESKGLRQVSDSDQIAQMVQDVLDENPQQVAEYLSGKEGLINWLFGQVMRAAKGKANPQVVREALSKQLAILGGNNPSL
jgi:aspartyl-tRNA(Asn)/glutamyl-tRNA(Gln) amidotransferase subunit B